MSWEAFANFLQTDHRLEGWDVLSFGYARHRSLPAVASALHLQLNAPNFSGYSDLAFVTHSIGGLIVQQALLDHEDLVSRVGHAFFFASPNEGMRLPGALLPGFGWAFSKFLRTQDFEQDSPYLHDLNRRWDEKFGSAVPFKYWSIAGDRDSIVSAVSLTAFSSARRLVVPGTHVSLIKPESPDSPSLAIVTEELTRGDVPSAAKQAAEGIVTLQANRAAGEFGVFMYCNHVDLEEVLQIAQQLRKNGIEPWLVLEKATTGRPWVEALMRDIDHVNAVGIFIGKAGPKWREKEQASVASEFAQRKRPIIPVYLPNCPADAGDFIDDLTPYPVVDFRQPETEPIEHLIEGISGRRPAPAVPNMQAGLLEAEVHRQRRRKVLRVVLAMAAAAVAAGGVWKAYERWVASRPEAIHSPSRYVRGPAAERVLVFVHGIYGDAKDTWTASSGAYWPDLIAHDGVFDNTDIYVAAYDTGIGNRMDIYELALSLDQSLKNDGVFSKHRQVVFVCHSLGGLVLQRLLLTHRDYASKVARIYFYSTPNEGAEVAAVFKLYSSDPLLQEMGSWEQHLQTIENDWRSAGFSIQRFCAYEKLDYKGIRVVSETSATRSCDNIPVPLNKNHLDIVKPSSVADPSYIFLRNGWRE